MKRSLLAAALLIAMLPGFARPIKARKIRKILQRSEVLSKYFAGFALYDLKDRKMIVEQNSDKYFTPASNTKLYTFYAGLKLLKDSIPGLQYRISGDSLIFWGTGDPTLLHPDFLDRQPIIQKLNASGKKLYFAKGRYTGEFYGTGWPYGDYNDYYQTEISELPLYGNIIRFSNTVGNLAAIPALGILKDVAEFKDDLAAKGFYVQRDILNNTFHYPPGAILIPYSQEVPYKVNSAFQDVLLKNMLPNYAGEIPYVAPANFKTLYSFPADTVFKHLLLPSDNFIAEHLLLNYAAENNLPMNTDSVIRYVTKNFLQDLPDKPQWADGSGLSRHDLFTPRDMVKICEKIWDTINNEERLFNLLPQGGKAGTIRNMFKGEPPFVFAKTGTLSNNHNLSGYLVTKSGKRLIFSFMNNNFTAPTSVVRAEMERILTAIHRDN
ncbi:MAG: peptidase D-Ala-D-Ala carboxypeptidase [Sphingobacteriaceae bacterium]|jgi:D-alanyl-D-alanine carboxypeptidase/D-alanyl-D-alanine-endopeptidase (penicillin-binding protein 4)|nr:peptidase D-Ala-D-Ala carboxypeptidase [Sphingobacteriaceae bacterium]